MASKSVGFPYLRLAGTKRFLNGCRQAEDPFEARRVSETWDTGITSCGRRYSV